VTLIAFATSHDQADIVTDTLTYRNGGRTLQDSYKVGVLADLNAAVFSSGSTTFGLMAWERAHRLARDVDDFDGLADATDAALPQLWDDYVAGSRSAGSRPFDSTVFAVGYSPGRRRFVAYAWDNRLSLERMTLDGTYISPAPPDVAMGPFERASFEQAGVAASVLDRWSSARLPDRLSVEQWIDLAEHTRRTRALPNSPLMVWVGGELLHVRLSHAAPVADVIHRFNDTGDEFAQLTSGTLHPLGQTGPCRCGSGKRYVDCHLQNLAARTCPCGSRRVFADCCSIYAEGAAP
jgi:hypothetical protein